jgi:hypothetical protein
MDLGEKKKKSYLCRDLVSGIPSPSRGGGSQKVAILVLKY